MNWSAFFGALCVAAVAISYGVAVFKVADRIADRWGFAAGFSVILSGGALAVAVLVGLTA